MRSLTPVFLLAAPLLLAAYGCSSHAEPGSAAAAAADGVLSTPSAASGSRLRAKFFTAGDSRQLMGFFDTQRNEDCTFQPAEDGRTRCLPALTAYAVVALFSDAACQVPLGVALQGCAAGAKYAHAWRYVNGCSGQTATELRRVVELPSTRYTTGASGCVVQPASSPPAAAAVGAPLALGEVVPWTDFVDAVKTNVENGAIAETVLVASDGARQHVGFHSTKLDADCTFTVMSDGTTRCLPDAPAGPVNYADSSCTKAAGVTQYSTGGCSETTTSNLWLEPASADGSTCAGIRAVYSLRAGTETSDGTEPHYSANRTSDGGSECSSTPWYGGSPQRAIEADVTASLPVADRIAGGSGRLVAALVADVGTQNLVPGWHDRELDADCSFALATDGKLRCLPSSAAATVFTTDGTCTSSARVAVLGQQCSGVAPGFGRVTSATCPPTTTIYALGTERRDLVNASTETSPGRCVSVAGVNGGRDATLVDPTRFVEAVPIAD